MIFFYFLCNYTTEYKKMCSKMTMIECGCTFMIESCYGKLYKTVYDRESLNLFSPCRACNKENKKLTTEDLEKKEKKLIDELWEKLKKTKKCESDGCCEAEDCLYDDEDWFEAEGNLTTIFYR